MVSAVKLASVGESLTTNDVSVFVGNFENIHF